MIEIAAVRGGDLALKTLLDGVGLPTDDLIGRPLIGRPLVATPLGTRLSRPSEVVLDIVPPEMLTSGFIKEDGERVLDAIGKRVA